MSSKVKHMILIGGAALGITVAVSRWLGFWGSGSKSTPEEEASAPPSATSNGKYELSIDTDSANQSASSSPPNSPRSPIDAFPADDKPANAKSPSTAATIVKVTAFCTSGNEIMDKHEELEESNPLERALVLFEKPKSSPAAVDVQEQTLAAARSAQEKKQNLYQLFGDGEDLVAHCYTLLQSLIGFQTEMVQASSLVAPFINAEGWTAQDMGIEIGLLCRESPEVDELFNKAVKIWLNSFEAIGYVVFLLCTREVPLEFAGHAELLGSTARELVAICAQWDWVSSSGLLSREQTARWHRAMQYQTDVVFGSDGNFFRVLVVPYFGVFHDARLQRSDVLLGLLDNDLFNYHELKFLDSELIQALAARDAARLAEQRLEAERAANEVRWAAYEAEKQALRAAFDAQAAAQAAFAAQAEAARWQKEQDEAQESPENYMDMNFLDD